MSDQSGPTWMTNRAAVMLSKAMEQAYRENPRKEMYRTIPQDRLISMLKQNVAEIETSYLAGSNDLVPKLADAANYVGFIYRNHIDPPTEDSNHWAKLVPVNLTPEEAMAYMEAFAKRYPQLTQDLFRLADERDNQMLIVEGHAYPEPTGWGKIGPEDDQTP